MFGYRVPWTSASGPPYSPSGRTSYRKISWSFEAIWCYIVCIALKFERQVGNAAADVPVIFRIWKSLNRISGPWDFTRSCGKTSVCLEVNRVPGVYLSVYLIPVNENIPYNYFTLKHVLVTERAEQWPSFFKLYFLMHTLTENQNTSIKIQLNCVPIVQGPIDIMPDWFS